MSEFGFPYFSINNTIYDSVLTLLRKYLFKFNNKDIGARYVGAFLVYLLLKINIVLLGE